VNQTVIDHCLKNIYFNLILKVFNAYISTWPHINELIIFLRLSKYKSVCVKQFKRKAVFKIVDNTIQVRKLVTVIF